MDDDGNIKNFFCERCYFLITNYTNDEYTIDKKILLSLKSDLNCNFCFGIFDLTSYSSLFSEIRREIDDIDHNDFKISFNFSSLFDIIHHYWRCIFKSKHIVKNNINEIDTNMIRIIFRQLFMPLIEKGIHESFYTQSDMEIEINFEFSQEVYDKINNVFTFIGKKFKFVPNDRDKSSIDLKKAINSLNSALITELFRKFSLNKLAYINNNILLRKFNIVKQNIYIKGNYLKLTRDIGQTKWEIKGVRVCSSSVEEEIKKKLIDLFKCCDCVMSAGGREDRDVRMLGKGRPFILEIINPKKNCSDWNKIEGIINKGSDLVKVTNIEPCDKKYIEEIKKYETSKQKYYTCLIWVEKELKEEDFIKIHSIKDIDISQKTPFRVMHRRTLMSRGKKIFKLEARKINNHFIVLNVLASAGTYIKEFIHSDLGRTNPSLVSILNSQCDILQLDVLDLLYQ